MNTATDTTCFGLLRHAPTTWNRAKRIQGQRDAPLTADGRRMALRWGRGLRAQAWDLLLVSDSGRALTTARLINRTLALPLHEEPSLREQDWGQWTGMTVAEVERILQRQANQAGSGWDFCPVGGEARWEVLARGRAALVEAARRWAGRRILVVTHEGVIKALVYDLMGRKFLPSEARLLAPFHLHRLHCRRGRLQLDAVNALDLESADPQ